MLSREGVLTDGVELKRGSGVAISQPSDEDEEEDGDGVNLVIDNAASRLFCTESSHVISNGMGLFNRRQVLLQNL